MCSCLRCTVRSAASKQYVITGDDANNYGMETGGTAGSFHPHIFVVARTLYKLLTIAQLHEFHAVQLTDRLLMLLSILPHGRQSILKTEEASFFLKVGMQPARDANLSSHFKRNHDITESSAIFSR